MSSKAERRAAEETAAKEAQARFAEELPTRLLMAMAWAHKLGISTSVNFEGDEHTPMYSVVFKFPERKGRYTELECMDSNFVLKNDAAQWELSTLIAMLQEHESFLEAEKQGLEAARVGWDSLTPEQRSALGLSRQRP